MKARPMRLLPEIGYEDCEIKDATHLRLHFNSPAGIVVLPIQKTKYAHEAWDWNGSVEKPTIRPSIKTTTDAGDICHSFVIAGQSQFLEDCTHKFVNQIVNLLEA